MKCKCGSDKETVDDSTGDYVCTNCGRIKAARNIVSNLSFSNQKVMGQFGTTSGEYSRIKAIRNINRDSDEIRLAKAFKLINNLSYTLNLPISIKEVTYLIPP